MPNDTATRTNRHYYTVAVTDGQIIDGRGDYVRDAIRYSCGHLHRTEDAAHDCMGHLRRTWCGCGRMTTLQAAALYHRCGGSPTQSAQWYNAEVRRVDVSGRHVPYTEAESQGGRQEKPK